MLLQTARFYVALRIHPVAQALCFRCLFWGSCSANERWIIVLVCDESQVTDEILDFCFIEKGLATRDCVGNFVITQMLFKNTSLVIATVQNSVICILSSIFKFMCHELHDY